MWKDNIKLGPQLVESNYSLDSARSLHGPVAGCYESSSGLSDPKKKKKEFSSLAEQLSICQYLCCVEFA